MATIIDDEGNISGANTHSNEQGGVGGELIVESNQQNFNDDVIVASNQVPVIVDFWAPWCEPCKQMTPIIEKLVQEYNGQVKLVKINIDDNQALAQQLRVQSIPMVYAFKEGRPVDAFNGALPESQLRQFIEKLTDSQGSPIDQAINKADELIEIGDTENASAIYNQIIEADPTNASAHSGLVKCLMSEGQSDAARRYLAGLSQDLLTNPSISSIQTALELEEQTADAGEVDELKLLSEQNPKDHQARYNYALALYGAGDTEDAIGQLIEILKQNRDWNEDAARQQLFKIFEALGNSDPITVEGRRKMSSVLFS